MPPLRYLVALAVTLLLIVAGVVYCASARRAFLAEVRQQLRTMSAAGELTPELMAVDIETFEPSGDFGTELPASLRTRLAIADALINFRVPLALIATAVSFGLAWIVGRK